MVAFEKGLNVYGAKERQLCVGPAWRQNHAQGALRGGSSRSPCGSLVGIELMWEEGMRPGVGDGLHPEGSGRAAAGSEPQDGMAGVIF